MNNTAEKIIDHKPELQIIDLEQGSDAWLKWRDTVIGASDGLRASNMSRALFDIYTGAKPRGGFNGNAATRQGHVREAEARWNYEMREDVTLTQVCGQRGFIAASSDGAFLQDSPRIRFGIEVKSPDDEAIHEKYIGGEIGDISNTHYHQCQQNIYVFDFDYIDFISYKPDATDGVLKEYTLRVWPNDEYIDDMVHKLTSFWNRVQSKQWPDAEKTSLELAKHIAGPSAPAMVTTGVPFALAQRVGDLVAAASNFPVSSKQSAEDAADLIKSMRQVGSKLNEKRMEITKPHRDYCTEVKAKFDSVTVELDVAGKALTGRLHAYNEEQERIRQEELRKQQEELRKKQEEEQRKLRIAQQEREAEERKIREAEQRRLDAEARAARSEAEAKAAQDRAENARLDALEQERLGKIREEEEARRLAKQAEDDAARIEQQRQKQGKTRGIASTASTRGTMQFEVVDLSKVPLEYMMLDESKVRVAIRRKDSPVTEIEGLNIFEKKTTVVR